MSDDIRKMIDKIRLLNEVRYIDTYKTNQEPILDNETIRVFHGFYDLKDVKKVLTSGLSGKQRVPRIYSYESGNNPKGLFVSVNFSVVKNSGFGGSGVIIEFSSKVTDLESPIWVGGRSYFVPGELTKSFKDMDEREQQRLINRQEAGESPYEMISKSDRPELADVIFNNPEKQALYIGDLDPNMIKSIWYNEVLHKERRTTGPWIKMGRKEFIRKLKIDTKRDRYINYLPNQDFILDDFVKKYYNGNYENRDFINFIKRRTKDEYEMLQIGFFPKQVSQIKQMRSDGLFDEYIIEKD